VLRQYHSTVAAASRVVDALLISAAWLASFYLRFYAPVVEVTKGFPSFSTYAALTPLVLVLWVLVLDSQGVYRPQRVLPGPSETVLLLRAHGVALLCFIALTYVFSEYRYSRGVLVYFGVIGAFALGSGRLLLRISLRSLRRRGHRSRNLLLVGAAKSVELLLAKMTGYPELGLQIRGVLVSDASRMQAVAGLSVLGDFSQIADVIAANEIDQVLIALSRQEWPALDRILEKIHDDTVDIQIVPDIHEYVTIGCGVENFDGIPLLALNETPLLGARAFIKRLTDVVFSLLAVIVLSPLLAAIAIAVKVTSGGKVLYAQERVGLDGRTFRMYKFRSMRMDAELATGAIWARKGDDRRTPIGAFLRATSLDELPQLFNVLAGHMSLVGPRPERPVFVSRFRGQIGHYMLRHKVKEGITGWAQVNGWRGDTSLDERILCDLYYIRNWSYYLDLKILFLTLYKGFVNKNAY